MSEGFLSSKYTEFNNTARLMAFAYHPLHLLMFLVFSTCFFSSISFTSTSKPQRLVTRLIHPRSVFHPNYNPNETSKDRMKLDVKHSLARLGYLQARIEGSLVFDDYWSTLSPSLTGRTILANLSIGQPPIPQLVIMDTASGRLWIMCSPCSNCHHHRGPLFDPSKSYTYVPLCTRPCSFSGCKCDRWDRFPFHIAYGDNSYASGTLGREMLMFETSDEGRKQVNGIELGCSHNVGYTADLGYNGVLGLNNEPTSLVSQIGRKFSYCIGSLSDQYYKYNQLILGEGVDLEGYPTSFQVLHGMYYVTMEGISVGDKRLDIDPAVFEVKENGKGGVIMDTGSTLTLLVDDVYKLLRREVRKLIGDTLRRVRNGNSPWLLCYGGTVRGGDLAGFPVVTFHFAGGADLALDTESLFHQMTDDAFCMVVGPISNSGSSVSIIGLLAQQSYNVGYDLVNQHIYLQRIDCELLSG